MTSCGVDRVSDIQCLLPFSGPNRVQRAEDRRERFDYLRFSRADMVVTNKNALVWQFGSHTSPRPDIPSWRCLNQSTED